MFNKLLRERIATLEKSLDVATQQTQQLEKAFADRAILASIERDGRVLRFTFLRHGKPYVIETYGTMSDDFAGWKRELLE